MSPIDKAMAVVAEETRLAPEHVYTVWFCFILGGWKALVSTAVADGLYYEVTYNKVKDEIYLDTYEKISNKVIKE